MKTTVSRLNSYCFVLLLLILWPARTAQGSEPTAKDILYRVRSVFSQVRDYAVKVHAEIDMEKVRVPPMDVEVFFKQPDRLNMKSKGFAMLPKVGVFFNPNRFNEENFYMSLMGKERLGQIEAYIIEMVPRKGDIKLRKLTMWVDPERWIPVRMHTMTLRGQTVNVDFEYALFHEKYWLPIRITAKLNMADFKGFPSHRRFPNDENDDMEEPQPMEGKMTIEFSDYRINTGLSDSLFEKEIRHNVR